MTAKGARKRAVQPSPKRASAARRQWNAPAPTGDFAALVKRVVAIIEDARSRVVRTVNSEMVLSYWHIGREIVEYVQRGESRAEYGEQVIEDLSAQLLARVGRGYSTRNLWYFRDFYLTYRERAPRSGPRYSARASSNGISSRASPTFGWCDGRVLDENTSASRCLGLRVQGERAERPRCELQLSR